MIEDRDEEHEEGIEAMTRALTNHSVAWWEMRKKQLPQKNNHRIVENNGMGVSINYDKDGGVGNDEDDDYEGDFEMADDFICGHPMMLEDPSTIGYTMSASIPSSSKRKPAIVYGSRDVVLRRRTIQGLYIFASLCTVILFIVLLGQRKLSNYTMVGSSMSLSSYLGMTMMQQTEPSNGNAGDREVGNTGY